MRSNVYIFLSIIALCLVTINCKVTKVLIFGGNGMLGSETVRHFLKMGTECTIVNRGNWYWDSGESILPFVKHITCDRATDIQESCPAIFEGVEEYDAIIDFSSYYPEDLQAVLDALKGRIKRYIYISSDSVYEVCIKKSHGGFSREEDAIRPVDESERRLLGERDSYGDRKLACEELLIERSAINQFEFMTLRLPDVLGPRDNTRRWFAFHLWLYAAMFMSRPVDLEPSASYSQISVVYSRDVARLIFDVIDMPSKVYNRAYNLAFSSTQTLEELILNIAKHLNLTDVPYVQVETSSTYLGIPSVLRGPIDISRAVKELGWTPTSFDDAMSETVQFYEMAIAEKRFRRELNNNLNKLNIRMSDFAEKYRLFRGGSVAIKDEL